MVISSPKEKGTIRFLFAISIFSLIWVSCGDAGKPFQDFRPEKYVAHAGGGIDGHTYTNSLEALNSNYQRGHRFFEVDIGWTSDDHLVLIHDWTRTLRTLFSVPEKVYSLEGFKNLKMVHGLKQLAFQDLAEWLLKHPDAYVVTDIKNRNINGLELISTKHAHVRDRIIPQIYYFEEYDKVTAMGFKNVILTLYRSSYEDDLVLDFAERHVLLAITMPINRSRTRLPRELETIGVFVYTHTVNDIAVENELKDISVDGSYTDFLEPQR